MAEMKPHQCPVCDTTAPLHAVRITSRPGGAASDTRDVVYMCAHCHARLDQGTLREFEFEVVMADLMAASRAFTDVRMEGALGPDEVGRVPADIVARSADGARTFVVECRGVQTIGTSRLRDALDQLKQYEDTHGARQLVLALPARLTAQQKALVSGQGIEVWDLDSIAVRFRDEIDGVTHPVLRPLLLSVAALSQTGSDSPETHLLHELSIQSN